MGKALPKLAAVSLCYTLLTGCASTSEPGPSFPEGHPSGGQSMSSANGSARPSQPGFPQAPTETTAWGGFVAAMTDNPVTRTIKSAGSKTAETLTPQPRVVVEYDEVSLNSPSPKVDAAMYVSMAQVHESSNNLEAATKTYEKALELDNKHVPALVGLAQVRFRQQLHEDAYKLFTEARKYDPHNLQAMLGQAHYHDTRENMPEATRLYTEATQRHADSAAAWNDLGLCLARQGRLPESQQTLQRAVQLEPTNVLYRNNVATVLVELNRKDEALVHLQQAHGPAPGHYNLGYLLHRRGDDQAAVEQFNMALRVDPSFQPARQWLEKLNANQGAPQRAGLPQMGRSALLLPGPDGHSLVRLVKKSKSTNDWIAPPEIDPLEEGDSSSLAADERAASEALDDQGIEVESEMPELAVATEEEVERDHVTQVTAIEVTDADDVNVVDVSESLPQPVAKAMLSQPRMVSGAAYASDSSSLEASDLPADVTQLQVADVESFQLETPPSLEAADGTPAALPSQEESEPYYEPMPDADEYQAVENAQQASSDQPVSLYEPVSSADSSPATKSSPAAEPAANHGWKKVRVEW